MSVEKKEGAEQTCSCGTKLICVKILKDWNGKKEEKLQWQNTMDGKPHFKFAGTGKWNCINIPKKDPKTAPTSDEFLKQKQKEIAKQTKITQSAIQETKKTEFTVENLVTIDKEIDKLIVIEAIVTKKLTSGDLPPNPAKVGMYMKFIYDKMNVKQ